MAESSYWYGLYKRERDRAKEYGENIKALQRIQDNLEDDLWDEIRNVNDKIGDLKEDLTRSVRHNGTFTSAANALTNEKEKAATADPLLKQTDRELQEEISRLNTKKTSAEEARDTYYERYEAAKEEERQERLQALKDALLKGAIT